MRPLHCPPDTRHPTLALSQLVVIAALAGIATAAEPDRDAWRADTRAVLPRADTPPVCDGAISDGEWAGAWCYDGVLNPVTMNLFPRSVTWCVAWDEEHIYVACRSPLLKGEEPKDELEGKDVSVDDLRRADSVEIWLSAPESRAALHFGCSLRGRIHCTASGVEPDTRQELLPVSAAKVHDGVLDFEVRIPVGALGRGRGNQSGDAWRMLLARSFQAGSSLQTLLPNGTGLRRQDAALHPLFTLTEDAPFVRLANPCPVLYAGRAAAALEISNPSATAASLAASLRISDADGERFHCTRVVDVPPGKTVGLQIDEPVAPAIDPEGEAEYRYALTVAVKGGETLLQTHFVYDPTDSRGWLGDALPQGERSDERVLVVDPGRGGIPFKFSRQCEPYADLPEGHRIRLTVRRMWEPSKRHYYDSVQDTVSVDAEGKKHGVERIYNRYGYSLERTVSWHHGVQHGPEETMAVEDRKRFARTVTPWEDGVVHGTKRVFHVNGQVMTEVEYVKGRPVGTATSYDREGRVTQVARYKHGVRHGAMTDYWPLHGKTKRTVPYRRGLIDGVVRDFYENGQLRRERPFRDDLLHGTERQYDRTGKIVQTLRWRKGDAVTEDP